MPQLKHGEFTIDYMEVGEGPLVVLVHGAASNMRQWRKLIEDYQHRFRFLALNLYGYGETSAWPGGRQQTMADQVALVQALCARHEQGLALVGHSFGASVAAMTARALGEQAQALVLLEANPFPLLASAGKQEAHDEIVALWDYIRHHSQQGAWALVAARFVDYWLGEGAWQALAEDRQQTFIAALPNNIHEWDAIMHMDAGDAVWQQISASTLLLQSRRTNLSISSIYEVLRELCPHWQYREVAEGGHMAAITRPDLVNPLIVDHLDAHM